MDFKIIFITPYEKVNILDDNIDLNVVLPNGDVYFTTLFTVQNVQRLLNKVETGYFGRRI